MKRRRLRLKRKLAWLLMTSLALLPESNAEALDHAEITIPVAPASLNHRYALTRTLYLTVSGNRAGWELGVFQYGKPEKRNLLYESVSWHGPHPSQFDAWATASNYWPPGPRRLPVVGHNLVIIAECIECRTSSPATDPTYNNAVFVSGSLRIAWPHRMTTGMHRK